MGHDPRNATETVEALEDIARVHAGESVCVGDLLDEFGHRSFGIFILVPALIEVTPIGGIPGLPTFLAVVIGIVAAQLLMGKDHVWLPGYIQRRAVRAGRLMIAARKLEGMAAWLDARFRGRMRHFTRPAIQRAAALIVIALAITVPPLEFLPFASSMPMLAIAAFGLAILVRDGLLMLAATALSVAALSAGTYIAVTSEFVDKLG